MHPNSVNPSPYPNFNIKLYSNSKTTQKRISIQSFHIFKKESFKNTSAERTNLRYLKPIYSNCINRESWWDSFEKFLDAYDEKSVNLSEKHIIEIIAVFCYYINVKSLHCRLPQKIKTHPNYKYFETFISNYSISFLVNQAIAIGLINESR